MSLFQPDFANLDGIEGGLVYCHRDAVDQDVRCVETVRCAVALTTDGEVVLELGTRTMSIGWLMTTELALALSSLLVQRLLEDE